MLLEPETGLADAAAVLAEAAVACMHIFYTDPTRHWFWAHRGHLCPAYSTGVAPGGGPSSIRCESCPTVQPPAPACRHLGPLRPAISNDLPQKLRTSLSLCVQLP